jgi:hypothetical protein
LAHTTAHLEILVEHGLLAMTLADLARPHREHVRISPFAL